MRLKLPDVPLSYRTQIVERVVSVLSSRSLLLGAEELYKFAPDLGKLWRVNDVTITRVSITSYDIDSFVGVVREEPVAIYTKDELCWQGPLHALAWGRQKLPMQAPVRIEGPSGVTVQLWLSLIFRYELSKEPHA